MGGEGQGWMGQWGLLHLRQGKGGLLSQQCSLRAGKHSEAKMGRGCIQHVGNEQVRNNSSTAQGAFSEVNFQFVGRIPAPHGQI